MTDIDIDFSPVDAEGLAAWFARAEDNTARLRRRLLLLGHEGPWADPETMPQGPKSDPVMPRAGGGHRTLRVTRPRPIPAFSCSSGTSIPPA